MPYYDQYSGMEVETEEERKKREEEAANAVAHTQEVKTYGDGSQTVTTTQEVPAAGPIAPDETLAETQRLQRQNAQPPVAMAAPAAGAGRGFVNPAVVQPVNPAFNQEQYNAQMAQAESGGNANIGYHNQAKGSAYGPYGMTAASYADARRANPSLPADITQATPEQLTQAQNTYTQQNAQTLNSFGIPVDANTLSAAHFLGATGLKNFLESGTISRAAAAANGGEENVRKILTQRLGGTVAAASGGVTAQAPQAAGPAQAVSPEDLQRQQYALGTGATGAPGIKMPMAGPAPEAGKTETQRWIDSYQAAGADPLKLLSISKDETAPQYLRDRAHQQAFENMDRQIKLKDEEQRIRGLLQAGMAGDPKANKEVANEMSSKAVTMGKYVLAKIFAPELAGEYAVDLGFGNTDKAIQVGGKAAIVTFNARGKPLDGTWADGEKMTQSELINAASDVLEKGVHVTKVETVINPKTGEEATKQTLSNGKERYLKGGVQYTGDTSNFTHADEFNKNIDIKIRQIDQQLAQRYAAGPTDAQRADALRRGGIPTRVIEQQMGLAEGALTGTKVKEEPKQAAGTTPAPTPAKAAVGSTVLPSGRPFNPNNPPEAIPGQLKSVHAADVKAWEDRHKLYTKQADSINDARTSAEQTLADINQLLTHPGLSGNVGKMGLIPNMPGSESSNAQALIDKVKGGTFLSAVQKMKGSGSVSNIEGDKAQAAIAALSQKQSEAEFRKNLIEYANTIKRTMNTASGKIGEAPDYPEVSRAGQTSDVRKRADDIIGRK